MTKLGRYRRKVYRVHKSIGGKKSFQEIKQSIDHVNRHVNVSTCSYYENWMIKRVIAGKIIPHGCVLLNGKPRQMVTLAENRPRWRPVLKARIAYEVKCKLTGEKMWGGVSGL